MRGQRQTVPRLHIDDVDTCAVCPNGRIAMPATKMPDVPSGHGARLVGRMRRTYDVTGSDRHLVRVDVSRVYARVHQFDRRQRTMLVNGIGRSMAANCDRLLRTGCLACSTTRKR
jgi:hypothetical protein